MTTGSCVGERLPSEVRSTRPISLPPNEPGLARRSLKSD
jgi:hypothetical protein